MNDEFAALLRAHPLPDRSGGKDDSGTVLVIGGPATCPGAALLAGEAALRVGSGRVQLVVHTDVAAQCAVALPEALVEQWDLRAPLPNAVADLIATADAIVLGSGTSALDGNVVGAVAETVGDAALVLDAGALAEIDALTGCELVLAPNAPEASRLADREDDERALAALLSARYGRAVAVRGQGTVVADGAREWCADAPPPGLGTPGSGDVYMGVLAAILAAGVPSVGALGWATALHAKAATLLSELTPVGYLARDIARRLPEALAVLT